MEALRLQKKFPEVSKDEMFDLVNRFKCVFDVHSMVLTAVSAITTNSPGRVDKTAALQAIQSSGQSYDTARETLKHVSVDASGKLELEDWVEVSQCPSTRIWNANRSSSMSNCAAQRLCKPKQAK